MVNTFYLFNFNQVQPSIFPHPRFHAGAHRHETNVSPRSMPLLRIIRFHRRERNDHFSQWASHFSRVTSFTGVFQSAENASRPMTFLQSR